MKTENKPRQHGKMPILIGVAFVIPALMLFSVFILYPLTTALSYSFAQ